MELSIFRTPNQKIAHDTHNNPNGTDRAFASCVDPDQMPQNTASDQGLHCLPYIQLY